MQNLGNALGAWRRENSLGVRAAAKMIGVGHNTLSRLENGKPCDAKTLAAVLFWLLKGDGKSIAIEATVDGSEATLSKKPRKR